MTVSILHPSTRDRMRATFISLLAILMTAIAVACAPAPREPSGDSIEIPDTRVGAHAAWALGQLNADKLSSEAQIEARFDPALFESVPVADLRSKLDELRALQPWKVTAYEGTATEATLRIVAADAEFDLQISVGPDDRISGFFFALPQVERTPAADWEGLRDSLESAPFNVSLQVVEEGTDAPLISIGEPGIAPVGSIIKLYILGAVSDAIAGGQLTWESSLTIDSEVRSLPTGELQNLPDGATVTVLEAAQKMIAISDNTATDLLIRAVGRDAVAAELQEMGHSEPAWNTPLLTTREFFWIGWGDPDLRDRWAAADTQERQALLNEVPAGLPDVNTVDWSVPAWQSGVDWFANADDIGRAHLALQEKAKTDAGDPIRDILAANSGVSLGPEWTYGGFKGGSATGVLAGSWYLEREGRRPVIITLFAQAADPTALTDSTAIFGWAEDAARLLTEE